MPRKTENIKSEATPHFDGKRDIIISDPTGNEIGVVSDFKQPKMLYTIKKLNVSRISGGI